MNTAKTPLSERIKKVVSSFLIFAILFGQTVHIPLLQTTQAAESDFPNLVAVLVSEKSFSGDLKNKLERYGEDVQANLAGSRAIVVSIPEDATPEKIAALLEKLYYEGDGKGTSRLVGTVLVGELPMPVVHRSEKTFLSVFPYVDFVDKSFVYKSEKGYYEYSSVAAASDIPEIWHGIVRSNTGDFEQDQDRLEAFFDKTHEFYSKEGRFEASKFRTQPHVFYFDSYRDQLSSRSSEWKSYQLMLQYAEEIAYNRFSKHLAKTVYEAYQSYLGADVPDASGTEIGEILAANTGSTLDFRSAPDVQTRDPIEKSLKRFFEVMSEKYLGDILRYVHNAGRYGTGNDVRVDIPAVVVGKSDELMKRSLKDANTAFEGTVDALVRGGIARNVAVGLTHTISDDSATAGTPASEGAAAKPGTSTKSSRSYRNFIYGKQGADIKTAADCSIVRGSTLPVEANRGYDVTNSEADASLLQSDLPNGRCFPGNQAAAMSFWGNNSPLKLDVTRSNEGIMTLKNNVYDGFIKPIFDMGGAKEIVPNASLPIASPNDCTAQRLWVSDPYKVESETGGGGGGGASGFPSERPGQPITCITDTVSNSLKIDSFDNYFNGAFPSESCTIHHLVLDGSEVKKSGDWCDLADGSYVHIDKTYSYKKVLSVVEHKSPTDQEYGEELKNFLTPSLPADKDRYVDFISAKGNYKKISYPNLFRISFPEDEDLTTDKAQAKIKEVLDAKSAEINALVASETPSGGLYEVLKNGAYPSSAKVDLYANLAAKPEMLQSVVDAVVWNNLANATAKYAFLLEHHLDIDGNAAYPLAGHKNDYEISYLVGKGDARNMYVKIDPAAKDGPGAEVSGILSSAAEQLAAIDASNVASGSGNEKAEFKCWPADGVPLPQWLPAIFCWLWSILPPTISAGNCSPNSSADIAEMIVKYFGWDSDKDGVPDYQEDTNANGIIDGGEYVKDGNIRLSVVPKRVPYRESAALSAILENKDGVRIYVDSLNEVSFDVTRIVTYSGTNVVETYRRGAEGVLGDGSVVKDYVNFSQINVRAKDGKADYVLTAKDRDADVYFDATVAPRDKDGKAAFVKVSDEAKLEIRSESLKIGLSSSGASVSTYAKAGEYSELSFPITKTGKGGAPLDVAYPVAVKIVDDDTSKQIADTVVAAKSPWTYSGPLLKQSGNYRFEFTDKQGVTGSLTLTVTAGNATKIELSPSSSLFVKNETVTVLAKIVDQFGNPAKGDLIDLSAKISGGGYFVENKASELNKAIVEGYTTFEVSTSDGGKDLVFDLEIKKRNLKASTSFHSLDYAKAVVDVENRNSVVVGKEPHAVTLKIVDGNGKDLPWFDGVAALNFPALSGIFDTNYVTVKDGKTSTGIVLTPKYVAGKDLKIDVRVPGIRDVEGNVVTVLPDVPMRVSLETEKPAIEARTSETETVTAKLFDRYGNLAYNHADGALSVKFSIPEHFRKYLRFPGKKFESETKFSGGIANVSVETTRLPGSPYVIAEVSPGLESNSYTVTDGDGKSVTISGYSKGAVVVDSYYLWNKEKVSKVQYNGLYTVLAGADFGNFTERDYLAGEILFNPDSRSMAVTALVNDATAREKTFSVTPGGKIELPSDESLVTAEVSSVAWRTSVGFYDPFYKEYVARAYFNFAENSARVACKNDGNTGIDNCEIPAGSAFTVLKGYANATAVSQNGLALVLNGARILEVDAMGAVSYLPNVRLEIDEENAKNLFAVKVFANNQEVGYFAAKLRSDEVVSAKPANVKEVLASKPGNVVVESVSNRYFSLPSYLGNSSRGAKGLSFYSNRDVDGSSADPLLVGGSDKAGFEQYREKEGTGWEGQNKTLLEFAGGSSVGEATRFNMTYSTVNLWDPVFRVKKAENEGTYDRTIGTKLLDAAGDTIESYKRLDFNGDAYDDLVVFFESGKIRLFENVRGTLRDLGYLAYVADAGKARKAVGDFAGDGYSDIVAVTKKGKLILLDNEQGKFTRKDVVIVDASEKVAALRGKIMQLESYNMDRDGKTDLIVSDESGELNVLYGKELDGETVFTKKLLDDDLALRLTGTAGQTAGAAYFDGIPQLQNPTEPDQAKYLAESKALAGAGDSDTIPPEIQKASIDSKLYYVYAYQYPVEYTGSTLDSQLESRLASTIGNDPENPKSPNTALQAQVLEAMKNAQSTAASGSFTTSGTYNETRYKTFLRSEFAKYRDLTVNRSFRDVNGDVLKSEDPVEITITLGNSGSTVMKNVAYMDSFDKNLFSETETPTYSVETKTRSFSGTLSILETSSYDYLFEGFDIRPGETVTIKYGLMTNPVSFGKFVVGKLESDDEYGDVAMRANNICGEAMTEWKSVKPNPRSFEKVTKTFSADESTAGGLAGKFIDMNGNGQPDYIDVLAAEVPSADLSNMSKYYYDLNGGGTQYDASKFGVLLFRQIVDSSNGTVNSGNVEIARLVANEKKNNLQRSAEPGVGDVTVPVAASAVRATYDAASKTLSAGSQASTASSSLPLCGTEGYSTVKAPEVIGWRQSADAPNGQLELFFSAGTHSKDSGKTAEPCRMSFSSSSNPEWTGGRVIGEGWKILTKHTYNAYALAAKTADYRDSSSNVPDDYDDRGNDLYSYDAPNGGISIDGLTSGNVAAIEATIDEIVQGLGCWFGGGACISMPFNWAPLAPGSSPTVMGFPASSLVPSTGFPVFSALTGKFSGPLCIPTTWTSSPLDLGKYCGWLGAWGYLGDKSVTNFFRFYITPTLTGAVGIAACFWPVAAVSGRIPPKGVSPVVPGGNCIVAAKPLLGCKDDGSDGDVSSQGMANADGFFNANSCTTKSVKRPLTSWEESLIWQYVRGSSASNVTSGITAVLPYISAGPSGVGSSPMVGIGMASWQDPNFEVSVDPSAIKNFEPGKILKIKLDRVSAFPEFIMDWVNRQTEEVVNKLTSLPTLYVILPDFSKLYESGWNGFADKLMAKFKNGKDSYQDKSYSIGTKYAEGASNQVNSLLSSNKDNINTVGKNVSGLRTAYEFLSSLPIIVFETETVVVDIPMISDEDVDKAILDFNKTKAQWTKEIRDKKQSWSKAASKDGVNEKVFVDAEATVASIEAWARFLEDAKRFPDKLYRYLTWKQRYAEQILCNVESVERMAGGYIAENGKRFRAWVELYVMLKAILKSWQLMVDLFYQHISDCGVCRNERYDLKHFIFKVISAVIPKIPIIKFPKWPDIVVDLHNIRLGLRILMPEFDFHISPIVLPHLPRLALPNVPSLGIGLPTVPAPPMFPKLPDLPDLPSLPTIKLPDLPPPPKIPKLFAAIQGVLQILKLVSKILCILRKNPFVPEWRAGDQIAQITERQGKLPLDFFNVEFPNFSLAFVDAIRVTTFVNVEFQVDFILEMAKSTFQPVNEFSTDLRSAVSGATKSVGIPSKINLQDTVPQGQTRIDINGPQGMRKVPDLNKMSVSERKALMTNFAFTLALSFKEFVAYLDREKNNELTLAEFKSAVASEASKLAGSNEKLVAQIAWVLSRAANYEASDTSLTDGLLADNAEKFGIVKDSIRAEIEETKALKTKIENFDREKNSSAKLLSALGGSNSSVSLTAALGSEGVDFAERGKALDTFETRSAEKMAALYSNEPDAETVELGRMGSEVTGRVKALTEEAAKKEKTLAETTPNPFPLLWGIDDDSGTLENGQTFHFDADEEKANLAAATATEAGQASSLQFTYAGIYVTDEGRQSRLFDYTEELLGSEEAVRIDVSKTGNEDVVYSMGSSLYLKRNLKSIPASHSSDSVETYDFDDILPRSKDPSAPNSFQEDFVSSNQINFGFAPAKTSDRKFRLEFYDYIDRFDRIIRGESAPATPKRSVDLFAEMKNETVLDAATEGTVVRKNVAWFESASGEGEVTYPIFKTLSEGLSIGVAAGRTVHTDSSGAKIRFAASGKEISEGAVIDVPENGNVEFLATGEFKVESGNVYLFEDAVETKTRDLSELRGLPALPDTRIQMAKPASKIAISYYDKGEYELRGPADYSVYDLWPVSPNYSVSIPQANDWYYSKLSSFAGEEVGAKASLTLLSPQIQADKEGPLVDFPSNYRIAVYAKDTVNLKKYVRDVSGISDFFVDADPTVDRDGNKVTNDDRDSDAATTGSGLVRGTDWSELVIGPFDAPKTQKVRMVATDMNGNKTFRDVTVTVFVPTPSIGSASVAQANGSIDVRVASEPIDLFRYRGGKLSRLSGSGETLTDSGGNFVRSFTGSEGVVVTRSGSTVANVNEKTGKIELKDQNYSVSVRAAWTTDPMTVSIVAKDGKAAYWQSFALPSTTRIEKVSKFSDANESGVFVKIDGDAEFVRNASNAASLPGWAFLTGQNREALVGIGNDGNVYLVKDGYSLSYKNDGDYPVIVVKNQFNVAVAEILFRIDAEYVIK